MEDLIPRWADDLIWVEVDMSVFGSNLLNMMFCCAVWMGLLYVGKRYF